MPTDPEESSLPRRCCRYCQLLFEPSKFRPDQRVCHQPECQRRRRTEYHRHKMTADTEYAQVVRDSRRKWRQAHPGYQKVWRQSHPEAQERNRQLQRRRDAKRRVHRFRMWLMILFGGLALLLAGLGTYSVIAYAVRQRTREIGIRIALGAPLHQVRNMVMYRGMRLALAGIFAGLAASFWLAQLLTTFLYGVKPHDTLIFVASLYL